MRTISDIIKGVSAFYCNYNASFNILTRLVAIAYPISLIDSGKFPAFKGLCCGGQEGVNALLAAFLVKPAVVFVGSSAQLFRLPVGQVAGFLIGSAVWTDLHHSCSKLAVGTIPC